METSRNRLQFSPGSCERRSPPIICLDYRVDLDDDFVMFYRREAEEESAKTPVAPPAPAGTKIEAMARKKRIFVSSEALPRADVHYLETAYCAWAADLEPARNEDARFLKWAPGYWKKINPAG